MSPHLDAQTTIISSRWSSIPLLVIDSFWCWLRLPFLFRASYLVAALRSGPPIRLAIEAEAGVAGAQRESHIGLGCPRAKMRIACLQFAPQVGDVDNNLNRADAILSRVDPEALDLLVLPELAFSGTSVLREDSVMHGLGLCVWLGPARPLIERQEDPRSGTLSNFLTPV